MAVLNAAIETFTVGMVGMAVFVAMGFLMWLFVFLVVCRIF